MMKVKSLFCSLILIIHFSFSAFSQDHTWSSGKFGSYLDIGPSRNAGSLLQGLNIGKTEYTNFQYAYRTWSGSHALLFNSYTPANLVNGSLSAIGNTKYANDVGSYSGTAAAIMFFGNGGTMNFYVSPPSTGKDTNINWGTPKMTIRRTGNVGIGTPTPDAPLTVAGKIHAQEIKVTTTAGADFVFEADYPLRSLEETEQFIKENKHLPDIPSADEMVEEGITLGEMNVKLLQKIEELTLYVIDLKKETERQNKIIKNQQEQINTLKDSLRDSPAP